MAQLYTIVLKNHTHSHENIPANLQKVLTQSTELIQYLLHHPKHSYSFLGRWNRCCGAVWSGILKIDHQQQRSLRLEGSVTVMVLLGMNSFFVEGNACEYEGSSGNYEKSTMLWSPFTCQSVTPVCIKTWTKIMFISPSRPHGSGSS